MSWDWPKADKLGLVRMVSDDANAWLTDPRLSVNWGDLHGGADERRELVRALYETVACYGVNYVPDRFNARDEVQRVRTPAEILDRPREGTCLDLSLLFCGLCLGCELIPWLVITRGHAFVLVSLKHRLRKFADLSRREWKWFLEEPLTDAAKPLDLLAKGEYLAVECTGFARSNALPSTVPEGRGRVGGLLPFDAALAAGRAQFDPADRPFGYAIDVAVARYKWGIEPDGLPRPRCGAGTPRRSRTAAVRLDPGGLPLLVDRVVQSQTVRGVVDPDDGRRGRPGIVLLAGDLGQAHSDLVRRLRLYDLPDWLKLRVDDGDVEEFPVQLPPPGSRDFDRRLRDELESALKLPERPSWAEVCRWFGDRKVPAVLSTTFNTGAWEQDGPARVEALLRAWGNCPDVPPGREPLVFVKWVYEPRAVLRVARWLGLDANARMAGDLARLSGCLRDGAEFPGVRGECPDRLADVDKGNLVDWCELKPVREFLGDRYGMDQEMEKVFHEAVGGQRRDTLPMGRVIPHLDQWLRKTASGA
jgi:hypothetical protein